MPQSTSELIVKYSNYASGVYRELIDSTVESAATASNNVVVVGQWEQGPIMRPVQVQNATQLHAIFGARSVKLEAKGCYGTLVAEHLLEGGGPIWVLNLRNIDQYTETLQVRQLAVNNNETDRLVNETIGTVYDTGKFWEVDPMYGAYGDGPVISFASVLQDTLTIVVEKYWSDDYAYTVAQTKAQNEIFAGDGLNDDDFVADYLIRVHVFKTNLQTAKLSVPNAIINGRLNLAVLSDIEADINSKYFATYTGTVGDVIDINGNNLNIATVINNDTQSSGLYMAINHDAVANNGIDLMGKGALKFSDSADALPTTQQIDRLGYTIVPTASQICVYMQDSDNTVGYMFGSAPVAVGDIIANESKSVRVTGKQYVDNIYTLPAEATLGTADYPIMPDGKPFPLNANGAKVYPATSPKAGQAVEFSGANALWYYNDFVEVAGAWASAVDNLNTVGAKQLELDYTYNGNTGTLTGTATDGTAANIKLAVEAMLATLTNGITFTVECTLDETVTNLVIKTAELPKGLSMFQITMFSIDGVDIAVNKSEEISTIASYSLTTLSGQITVADKKVTFNEAEVDIDTAAVAEMYGTQTPVYQINFSEGISSALTDGDAELTNGGEYGVSKVETINGQIMAITPNCFVKLDRWFTNTGTSAFMPIQGIVSLEKHFVNGTAARQNSVLDRLNDTGITTGFKDPTIFRCRYMIDSFKTYIEPAAKNQYATLANEAKRFLVLIPAPFYYELRTSKNPDFHDILGQFDMSYVAQGTNPDKPSTNSFSYPNTGESSKYIVPYMNVMYNDGFSSKVIPSVGAVGRLYYSKLNGTSRVYDIVAGDAWVVSGSGITGPEFTSGPDDRAAMEKMGTNVLQTIDGALQIRSSKTAYQTVISAFNYPETLEKCFYVSDQVESTLNGKLFKYNNADARLAVKTKADSVCDIMVADGVISSYENKCDLDNNPVEVRKAGIIVLDTVLYNEYGIRIAVHRTTVKDPEE